MTRIGIDLGGSKIEILALDESGNECFRHRVATPAGDYAATLEAVRDLVQSCDSALGVRAPVGVGTPGAISNVSGTIKNANSTCLNGQPLKVDLARMLDRPVAVANDANCFALSEATDGAGAGARVVFGVILGTGVGGGIVIDGRVLTGTDAIAGEWGHNRLPAADPLIADEHPGPRCYCGRRGCIETWLSGPALTQQGRARHALARSPADWAHAADAGESDAESLMQEYEARLARSLAVVVNILDPDVIVLGGGLSNLARLYRNVPTRLAAHVFSDRLATRIVPPKFGDASGARGAAWLCESPFEKEP